MSTKSVAELIATAEAAGTATPADVLQARREATAAAAQHTALRNRVVEGDEQVTADELDKAKSLAEFARLRADAVAGKAERTAYADKLRRCEELRAEVEGYRPGSGERLAKLLAEAEQAITVFVDAVHDRNEAISGWRRRMHEIDHEGLRHENPLTPPATQGHIGHNQQGQIIAGRRRMGTLDPGDWLVRMLNRVEPSPGNPSRRLDVALRTDADSVYEQLAKVDAVADPDPDLRFFRHRNGGVIAVGAAQAEAPGVNGAENSYQQQVAKGELVEISREEAWGQ